MFNEVQTEAWERIKSATENLHGHLNKLTKSQKAERKLSIVEFSLEEPMHSMRTGRINIERHDPEEACDTLEWTCLPTTCPGILLLLNAG